MENLGRKKSVLSTRIGPFGVRGEKWIQTMIRIDSVPEPQDLVFEVREKERVERRLEFLVTEWEKSAEWEIRTPVEILHRFSRPAP